MEDTERMKNTEGSLHIPRSDNYKDLGENRMENVQHWRDIEKRPASKVYTSQNCSLASSKMLHLLF